MYPVIGRVGSFEISSFGLMVAIAALVGLWIFSRELARSHLRADAVDAAAIGVAAGLLGAKLLFVAEHAGEEPLAGLLFARAGLSWYGGFGGGVAAGLLTLSRKRLPMVPVLAAATPALTAGHALGRIGCFLVGDDYGRPTSLPWGVAFPEGAPPTVDRVHPTQLYEAAVLVVVTWLLIRWRRAGVDDRHVLGRYLVAIGVTRFVIEFLRINVRVALDITVAQWASLIVVAIGTALLRVPATRRMLSIPGSNGRG
ncbi:MAG: Prolipoprotein diacylglyceryl transferase [Acidobacteria bacterium]|nr:Prolipoprotein diacylglyceryl transferase [Acidobacteriota bacterium]